jgi:tetratricopeptide (TPR) repeat protein
MRIAELRPFSPTFEKTAPNGYKGLREDLEAGIAALRQASELLDSDMRAESLASLGQSLLRLYEREGLMADLDEAVVVCRQAVALAPAHSSAASLPLGALGSVLRARYARTGSSADLDEAIRYSKMAIELESPGSLSHVHYLNNLVNSLHDRAKLKGDIEDYAELVHAVEMCPPEMPGLPTVLSNLGHCLLANYMHTGNTEDLERAIELQRQAVDGSPPDSPFQVAVLGNLGITLHKRYELNQCQVDLDEATELLERAAEMGLQTNPNTALVASGNWLHLAFNRRAWRESLKAYEIAARAIKALLQAQWHRDAKESWLKEMRGMATLAAYASAKVKDYRGAVEILESGRAILLSEVLEQNRRDLERLTGLGHGDLLERYRQASERMQFVQLGFSSSVPADPSRLCRTDQREQMAASQQEVAAAIESIRAVPGYEDFFQAPSFENIQAVVKASLATLVYLLTTRDGSLALILRADQADKLEVPMEALWLEDLVEEQLVELLMGAAAADDAFGGYLGAYFRWRRNPKEQTPRQVWFETLDRSTRWLWGRMMGPLIECLSVGDSPVGPEGSGSGAADRGRAVVLIPTGFISVLPLHAAWTEDRSTRTGRRFALDHLAVSYAPSAKAFVMAKAAASRSQPRAVLAVDNPDGSLPCAGSEVEAIVSYFPPDCRCTLRGKDAGKSVVRAQLNHYPVLHFATHGRAGWHEPLASELRLAGGESLTLGDLLDLKLVDVRLVVLSACETAVPGMKLPDEVVGLPTGLLQAGAAGVVASLWSVEDVSTAMLMEHFYRAWRENGLEPAEALRRAQRWLRDTTNSEKAE